MTYLKYLFSKKKKSDIPNYVLTDTKMDTKPSDFWTAYAIQIRDIVNETINKK